jgi:NADPH-dependent curcumin reductase CurA
MSTKTELATGTNLNYRITNLNKALVNEYPKGIEITIRNMLYNRNFYATLAL